MATDISTDVFNGLPTSNGMFSTVQGTDFTARKKVFNAVTNSKRLRDMISKPVVISDIVVQMTDYTDERGETTRRPRTILITPEGEAYGTTSVAVLRTVQNLISLLGMPHEWPEPLTVVPQMVRGSKGLEFMQLSLA